MTRLLVISAFIGMAIAGIAISMEAARIWQTRQSLIFLALAVPGIGLLWHFFLWRRNKFKLGYD